MKYFLLPFLLVCVGATNSFSQCATSTSHAQLNINDINATINNAGSLWDSLTSAGTYGVDGYEAPKGSGIKAIAAGGLWIGGIDAGGQLFMAASTYRQNGNDYAVGPYNYSGSFNFDTVWVVYKSTIDSFIAGQFTSIPPSIKYWPAQGNPNLQNLPDQSLAPFVDVKGNGIYDPANGDYPNVKGDEATWEVFNDDCSPHNESGGLPLKIEVHLLTYAFNDTGCLNNTTFYSYEIIDNALTVLDSTFIGIFVDPDLGCYLDDYIGCDSLYNMGICYNGQAVDGGGGACSGSAGTYGKYPPILGVQMTNLPTYLRNNRDTSVKMSSFVYWNNDFTDQGNPVGAAQYYNYLTASWKDGTPFTKYGNGYGGSQRFHYTFPSDPTDSLAGAWSECSANETYGDRRFMMNFGPITLLPGSITKFTYDVLFDNDTSQIHYPCPSFSSLTDMANCVQAANVTGINTPVPEKLTISFYPNPMGDAGTFSFKPNTIKEIKLYTILGEQVRDYTGLNGTTLQLTRGNLSAGIYFYSVIGKNGMVGNGKIVVQ